MANFTVFSATGQDMTNLWPAAGGANIQAQLSSAFDPNTYWIELSNGVKVRYLGTAMTYAVQGFITVPSGGTYNAVEITDAVGNVLARLENFGDAAAADIVNMPAATVLAGTDTLTGGAGDDSLSGDGSGDTFRGGGGNDTLDGGLGNDTFIYRNGEFGAAESVDGGGNYDTLVVEGDDSAPVVVEALGTISSIEELRFQQQSGSGTTPFGFKSGWIAFSGWAAGLTVFGRGNASTVDFIELNIAGTATVSLAGMFSLFNWDNSDFVRLVGAAGAVAETVTGTNSADEFIGNGGADVFDGQGGNDRFVVNAAAVANGLAGASFDGGIGDDAIVLADAVQASLMSMTLDAVDRVHYDAAATLTLAASQIGAGLGSSAVIAGGAAAGGIDQFRIVMGSATTVNLSSLNFQNWEAIDRVRITGDADAETLTGSSVDDTIVSGGGLDTIDGGGGDDLLRITAADGSFNKPAASINGGSGTDTLEMVLTGGPFDWHGYEGVSLSSIEKLRFSTLDYTIAYFDAVQVGPGLSPLLEVIGSTGDWNVVVFDMRAPATSFINLSGFTFTNWNTGTDGDFLQIYASNSNDSIIGSQADDQILTGGGQDTVDGQGGNDIVVFSDRDWGGSPLATTVNGGSGADKLSIFHDDPDNDEATPTAMDLRQVTLSGFEVLRFGGREDFTRATIQVNASFLHNNAIGIEDSYGYAGSCALAIELGALSVFDFSLATFTDWNASGEDFIIITGDGDGETATGSAQRETYAMGGGADTIDGRGGGDTMEGGGGNDIYFDRAGDTITESLGAGYDTVNTTRASYALGPNLERVNFIGSGNFVGTGNGLANRFQGGTGDDRFVDVLGGADIFSGGAGTDTIDFRTSSAGAIVNLATNVHGGAAAGDSYSGIEKFLGSNTAADTMTGGGTGRWVFVGGGGGDTLTGGIKNDQLIGQGGSDTLVGGADRDSLDGGTGNDMLTGGSQDDVFVFVDAVFGQDTITDFVDGADSFKIFSAVAASLAAFTIINNGTTSVMLTLNTAPANVITVNGATPITIAADDFVFY